MLKKPFFLISTSAVVMLSLLAGCNTNQQQSMVPSPVTYEQFSTNNTVQTRGDGQYRLFDVGYDTKRYDGQSNQYQVSDRNRQGIQTDRLQHMSTDQLQTREREQTTRRVTHTTQNATMNNYMGRIISLTNRERTRRGLTPLKADPQLSEVAQAKSDDMASKDYLSHTSPTYGTIFQMLTDFGVRYTGAAENISAGQSSPDAAVTNWMKNERFRTNILNPEVTHIGVGYSKDEKMSSYWTQVFIKR
ncbi:CAP domain-containing protein [Bacillus solimangrovi]|uniref:SCP domain-containing protein n=1 Tax=Bacillus solimangrovi TaxID=1305675 RepID=A0A1E5LI71_9BACI|nr:CAP domain-containing protein [Bacillus solimangrovi]OEH93783.1 hypothetical protein BFG57_11410 [Bacillus solimangrovi]